MTVGDNSCDIRLDVRCHLGHRTASKRYHRGLDVVLNPPGRQSPPSPPPSLPLITQALHVL